jgi:hypothetical protein
LQVSLRFKLLLWCLDDEVTELSCEIVPFQDDNYELG